MSVQLYLGDCLEILPTLEAGSVDAVITDPPYGIGLKRKTSDFRDSPNFDNGESLEATRKYNDNPERIKALIPSWHQAFMRVGKRALVFCGAAMLPHWPISKAIGCVFTPNGAGRCSWGFQCMHPILYYGKDPYLANRLGGRPNGFRTEQPNREQIDHPCPKPLDWMIWAINRISLNESDTILDPFMGSGTTGVACVKTGRNFIGIEIDPDYYAIAEKRIAEAQMQPRLEGI